MLQTSRFQVSRKKLQVFSTALKFARFVVLGINSSKHNIHVICFCYKFWNSRHSQLLQMSNVSSWFPDLKKKRKKKLFYQQLTLKALMGDTRCVIQTVDISRHDSYADCFYHLSANLSDGCHYTHLESGRNNRYDRIFVQISDLVDKYFQDHCTITTI